VREFEAQSQAATEIGRLWLAIDRSVRAIHGAYQSSGVMHRVAA
jgi:chromosome partitioning protein